MKEDYNKLIYFIFHPLNNLHNRYKLAAVSNYDQVNKYTVKLLQIIEGFLAH